MGLLIAVLVVLAILVGGLVVHQIYYWKQISAGKTVQAVRYSILLFGLALLFAYGLLDSIVENANEEPAWTAAYATLAIVSSLGAVYLAWKGR